MGPQKDSRLSMLMSVSLKCSSGLWRDCLKSHTAAQRGLLSAPYFTGSRGAVMRCFISCWMKFFFFPFNRTQGTRSRCVAARETGADGQTLIYRTGGRTQAWMYACIHTHRHTQRVDQIISWLRKYNLPPLHTPTTLWGACRSLGVFGENCW